MALDFVAASEPMGVSNTEVAPSSHAPSVQDDPTIPRAPTGCFLDVHSDCLHMIKKGVSAHKLLHWFCVPKCIYRSAKGDLEMSIHKHKNQLPLSRAIAEFEYCVVANSVAGAC